MPEITVSMAAGRTDEQKAGMMRDITQALVKNLGVDADAVVIQINEAPLHHKMKGGKTFVERAAAAKKRSLSSSSHIRVLCGRSRTLDSAEQLDVAMGPGRDSTTRGTSWTHATSSGSA